MRTIRLLAIATSALLLTAASPKPIEGDEPGECTDHADNDHDAAWDCLDDGCATSPDCTRKIVAYHLYADSRMSVGEMVTATGELMAGDLAVPGAKIVWASSDPKVVTVTPDGAVRAVADGKATITAKSGATELAIPVTVGPPPMSADALGKSGVIGAIRDDQLVSALGSGDQGSMEGIGGLIGARGTPTGGGGAGSGDLGGPGTGSDFGAKPSDAGGTVVLGEPIILGSLDRSLLDSVIKRNLAQIRYCYQKELHDKPTLGGKIVEKFVISKDGSVASAETKSTTLNDAAVESCVSGRFLKFQFPEPKGGGIVIASYPLVFSPS